jgi:GT2 family glycosyltransferase
VSQPASVSVIIVTFNSHATVFDCLRSLSKAQKAEPMELIIVDNNSSDGAPAKIIQEFPDIRLISNRRNQGFASACNIGAKAATGEYLLFLNPDVMLDEGAVPQLLAAARSRQKVGAVAGRLRFPDGAFQANCRHFPTISNLIFSRGSALGRLILNRLFSSSHLYTLPDCAEVTEVPAVAGTLMLINRDLFLTIRGFDPRFFMYLEDTDLSLRLSMSGYKNLYVPQAGAIHGWGKGSRTGKMPRVWHHHQSLWRYFLKHYPNGFSLILLPVLLTVNFILVCLIPERSR